MAAQAICTIITKSHLCYARTLTESVRQYHPEMPVYVLLADRVDGYFDPSQEPFELIQLEALPDQEALQQMCFYYTLFEFCCALRAWLHEYLWQHTQVEQWLFLDADTFVTHGLQPIFEQLSQHSVLINPHYQAWQNLDGDDPLHQIVLRLGIYNGGFLGVRRCQDSAQFIPWFKSRLQKYCFDDLVPDDPRGLYVDQRWLDFVPALFPNTGLLRHPGANLAHWNLWEHPLCLQDDGGITTNSQPLLFLHFSGWQIDQPEQVSRNSWRYTQQSLPVWEKLAYRYRDRLLHHGHETTSRFPYAFGQFSTGEPIQPAMRRAYYEDLIQGSPPQGNPFELAAQFCDRAYSPGTSVRNLQTELAKLRVEFEHQQQKQHHLEQSLQQAETTIAAMETSKFWQLRRTWFDLKGKFRRRSSHLSPQPANPLPLQTDAVLTVSHQPPQDLEYDQLYAQIREPKVNRAVSCTDTEADEITQRLQRLGIAVKDFAIDHEDYQAYFGSARYVEDFPTYYAFNLPEKSLEHYIAAKLLQLDAEDVYIDIASEGSPVPEIYQRLFSSQTYRQDLAYPAGLHGNEMGGNAANMPVPDGFASKMALHCSLEHFEQGADIGFVREVGRVLRSGGKVCIVPLYLALQYSIQTDPVVAVPQGVMFEEDAIVHAAAGWGNRHGRFYDPEHLVSRIGQNLNGLSLTVYRIRNAQSIDSSCYVQFAAVLEKA
jgi:hypothetical protein